MAPVSYHYLPTGGMRGDAALFNLSLRFAPTGTTRHGRTAVAAYHAYRTTPFPA